jgi:hypothetical protein
MADTCGFGSVGGIPVAQRSGCDNCLDLPMGSFLCMGLFSRFCVCDLRCTAGALDIPGVYVFKTSQQQKDVGVGPWRKDAFRALARP